MVTGFYRLRPVVDSLLQRAHQHAAAGELSHADSFFSAAIAADESPTSIIAYGTYLSELGELTEAVLQLQQGWELAKRQHDASRRAWACQALAATYRSLGQTLDAQQFQQLAIAAELEVDLELASASLSEETLLGSATDWVQTGETTAAEALLTSCCRADSNAEIKGAAQLRFGEIALQRNQLGKALQHFQAAEQQFRAAQDQSGVSHALESIGIVLLMGAEWATARESLDLASRIARHLGHRHRVRHIARQITCLDRALSLLATDPLLN